MVFSAKGLVAGEAEGGVEGLCFGDVLGGEVDEDLAGHGDGKFESGGVAGLNPSLWPANIAPMIKSMAAKNLGCSSGSDVSPKQIGRSIGKTKDNAVFRQ